MMNAVPDFVEHSKVINGCSDLFVEVVARDMPAPRSASAACRSASRSRSRRSVR
jgi:hypothetical protein